MDFDRYSLTRDVAPAAENGDEAIFFASTGTVFKCGTHFNGLFMIPGRFIR